MWFLPRTPRRKTARVPRGAPRGAPQVEPLEGREVPSVSLDVGPNVNASRLPFNQQEVTIAVNPANPSNLFIASNSRNLHQLTPPGPAQFAAYSMNGGKTWKYVDPEDGTVGDENDDLPRAGFDPTAAFDKFGNLFYAYNHPNPDGSVQTAVLLSTDGGKTFSVLDLLRSGRDTDYPNVVTGPGPGGSGSSVWVANVGLSPNQIVVQGASVMGLGAVNAFSAPEAVPGSGAEFLEGIAVGPSGQVLVSSSAPWGSLFEHDFTGAPVKISTALDPDGLGPAGFTTPQVVASLNSSEAYAIPAAQHYGINPQARLAYDRSSGPHRGRAYMVYNDAVAKGSADTNISVRFSDDNGGTWSAPVRVNDDSGTNSQFFPRIAVDPTTGYIAVSWYDCRNDLGTGDPGDRDGIPNDDTQFWAAVSTDGGVSFEPNVQVSAGTSSADAAWTGINQDYGDYTGLDFYGGKFYPAWADNSNSTGDNPPGAFHYFDVYTAAVTVTTDRPHRSAAVGSFSPVATQPELVMLSDTDERRGRLASVAPASPSLASTADESPPAGPVAFAPDLAQPPWPSAESPPRAGSETRLIRTEPADDSLPEQAAEGGARDTAARSSNVADLTAGSAEADGVVLWGLRLGASDPVVTADI